MGCSYIQGTLLSEPVVMSGRLGVPDQTTSMDRPRFIYEKNNLLTYKPGIKRRDILLIVLRMV